MTIPLPTTADACGASSNNAWGQGMLREDEIANENDGLAEIKHSDHAACRNSDEILGAIVAGPTIGSHTLHGNEAPAIDSKAAPNGQDGEMVTTRPVTVNPISTAGEPKSANDCQEEVPLLLDDREWCDEASWELYSAIAALLGPNLFSAPLPGHVASSIDSKAALDGEGGMLLGSRCMPFGHNPTRIVSAPLQVQELSAIGRKAPGTGGEKLQTATLVQREADKPMPVSPIPQEKNATNSNATQVGEGVSMQRNLNAIVVPGQLDQSVYATNSQEEKPSQDEMLATLQYHWNSLYLEGRVSSVCPSSLQPRTPREDTMLVALQHHWNLLYEKGQVSYACPISLQPTSAAIAAVAMDKQVKDDLVSTMAVRPAKKRKISAIQGYNDTPIPGSIPESISIPSSWQIDEADYPIHCNNSRLGGTAGKSVCFILPFKK